MHCQHPVLKMTDFIENSIQSGELLAITKSRAVNFKRPVTPMNTTSQFTQVKIDEKKETIKKMESISKSYENRVFKQLKAGRSQMSRRPKLGESDTYRRDIPYMLWLCDVLKELLETNVNENKNWSPEKGRNAFGFLEQYAINMLKFPWKREVRKINVSCGYFFTRILRYLTGAEQILGELGYCQIGGGLFVIQSDVIDSVKVTKIAFKLYLAKCECQALSDWSELFLHQNSLNLSSVECEKRGAFFVTLLKYRSKLNFDYDKFSNEALNEVFAFDDNSTIAVERRAHAKPHYSANVDKPCKNIIADSKSGLNASSLNTMSGEVTTFDLTKAPSKHDSYPNQHKNQEVANMNHSTMNVRVQKNPPIIMALNHLDKFDINRYSNNGTTTNEPMQVNCPLNADELDSEPIKEPTTCERVGCELSDNASVLSDRISSRPTSSCLHDVRHLSSSADEDNVAESETSVEKYMYQIPFTSLPAHSLSSVHNDKPDTTKKLKCHTAPLPNVTKEASSVRPAKGLYAHHDYQVDNKKKLSESIPVAKTPPAYRQYHTAPLLNITITNDRIKTSSAKWQCRHCTSFNYDASSLICVTCCKSREKAADDHLVSGRPQCSDCTLINDEGAKFCAACSKSLTGSPTYV